MTSLEKDILSISQYRGVITLTPKKEKTLRTFLIGDPYH